MIVDVQEEAVGRVVLPLTTAAGAALAYADLAELRIRLWDHLTRTVLNGRDGSVTPAPNVAAESGAIVWTTQPGDAVVVDRKLGFELHDVRVDYVYAGTQLGRWIGLLRVRNLGVHTITPPPAPGPGALAYTPYVPLSGTRPGRVFTLPMAPTSIELFVNGEAKFKNSPPGLADFDVLGTQVTLGVDLQPGDRAWANVWAAS